MTQEDKKGLLLKDLCARLPYYVKVAIDFKLYLELLPDDDVNSEYPYKKNLNTILRCSNKSIDDISQEPHIVCSYICSERFGMLRGYDNREYGVPVELIKPYLRPMSSMTEEERIEFSKLFYKWHDDELFDYIEEGTEFSIWKHKGISPVVFDWLNAHHFDYRGLIPMGLALEASEGIYN